MSTQTPDKPPRHISVVPLTINKQTIRDIVAVVRDVLGLAPDFVGTIDPPSDAATTTSTAG